MKATNTISRKRVWIVLLLLTLSSQASSLEQNPEEVLVFLFTDNRNNSPVFFSLFALVEECADCGNWQNDQDNNYAALPVITKKIRAYISVETGNSYVNDAIKDYLSLYTIPTSLSDAQMKIYVSLLEKNSKIASSKLSKHSRWFIEGSTLYSYGKSLGGRPWNGMVISQNENCLYFCPNEVFVIGRDFDGVVAATKRLVNARDRFLVPNLKAKESLIEDKDVLGISVFDLMHNEENRDYYRDRSAQFGDVVSKILNDNNFEVAIKTVRTYNDNTTLRLKNVNSDFSKNYKEVINGNRTPVVFSGGLFANLFAWEENSGLAVQLAQLGRDSWEIEMTGGPTTECSSCPNYHYEDLVDYYWPALIAGVEEYSGASQVDYVGHSNGCRVALDSLKNWSNSGKNNVGYYFDTESGQYSIMDLSNNPINTFIGVGCPGILNETTYVISKGSSNGASGLDYFERNNKTHISGREFAQHLELLGVRFWPDDKISLNLTRYYYQTLLSTDDNSPGKGLNQSKLYLIAGINAPSLYFPVLYNDGLVPFSDIKIINSSVYHSEGDIKTYRTPHNKQIQDGEIHDYIFGILGIRG